MSNLLIQIMKLHHQLMKMTRNQKKKNKRIVRGDSTNNESIKNVKKTREDLAGPAEHSEPVETTDRDGSILEMRVRLWVNRLTPTWLIWQVLRQSTNQCERLQINKIFSMICNRS